MLSLLQVQLASLGPLPLEVCREVQRLLSASGSAESMPAAKSLRGGLESAVNGAPAVFIPRLGGPLPKRYRPAPRPQRCDSWRSLEQFESYRRLGQAVALWCELEGAFRQRPPANSDLLTVFYGSLRFCRGDRVAALVKRLTKAGHKVCRINVLVWSEP
jgi:hypothetical protein